MQDAFFDATKKALNNITATYDTVWSTSVGLWNLRCMVNEIRVEFPNISDKELAGKFCVGSGIRSLNFKRLFTEESWEAQQSKFAWILLNNLISIFEGWLEELKRDTLLDMDTMAIQFPKSICKEIKRLKESSSAMLTNAFYRVYSAKRDRCYSHIKHLMHCYRVFKESRNCYMHNGSIANKKLVNEYKRYLAHATKAKLCVSEVPVFFPPVENEVIQLSLRGVVGFSYILIKILVSLDAELLCLKEAEKELVTRYRTKHSDKEGHFILRVLKPDFQKANNQVKHYIQQCGFAAPQRTDELMKFLIREKLVSK